MVISTTMGYVVHEMLSAAFAANYTGFKIVRYASAMFEVSGISMVIYALLGVFLGPRWFITPMFFVACFLIGGKILHRLLVIMPIKKDATLLSIVLPACATIQFAAAILAFLSWF